MYKLTLILLFGATFLPGFLSDPFDSRSSYLVDPPVSPFETDQIISYELVPLHTNKIREKRQAQTVSAPLQDETPDKSILNKQSSQQSVDNKKPILPDTKQNLQAIWPNLTRSVIPTGASDSVQQSTEKQVSEKPNGNDSLLRKLENATFVTSPNETTAKSNEGEGTEIPLDKDLIYPDFPPEVNDTIKGQENITVQEDDFKYYNTVYLPPPEGTFYYIDLSKENATNHEMLSNAHRRAATLKPKFEFPFYGHPISNLTVATGGFIYLGDQVHAWLAATQYVAPLMANFDSSTSDNDTVSYLSTDESFTVEWKEVRLQDSKAKGSFTFQTTLHKNGTIVFAYKNLPIPVKEINDTHHPVKIGLSDAYIRDKSVFVVKQKTIYEYHRIDLKDHYAFEVQSGSAVILTPQDTCLTYKTCEECTSSSNSTKFECAWCPKLLRCSDGFDRRRQDWTQNNCDKDSVQVSHSAECPSIYASTPSTYHFDKTDDTHSSETYQEHHTPDNSQVKKVRTPESAGTGAGGVIVILMFVTLVFASVGWLVYAYLYPHTPSGQLLIRYRPTQWAFRRGEARYTAASIHM